MEFGRCEERGRMSVDLKIEVFREARMRHSVTRDSTWRKKIETLFLHLESGRNRDNSTPWK